MPSRNIGIILVAIAKRHCLLTGVATRKLNDNYSWQLHTTVQILGFQSSPVISSPVISDTLYYY